ncbi:MAG: aminopeptidase [Verrucomicrobiota bacterium]|jgi:aminopeptidase N
MKFMTFIRAGILLPAALLGAGSRAEEESLLCRTGLLLPVDSSEHLKYAPSREVDIVHLILDVTPDFKAQTVSGKVTIRFKPIAKPLEELRLDGIELSVRDVSCTAKLLGWQATDKNVILTFAEPLPADQEASVTIQYSAVPKHGLYFRTPDMGYKPEDMHVWSQGEPNEARHWFPCFDAPNEKSTSEVICHVPEAMTVLSNGRLDGEEHEATSGLKAVRWIQDKPHPAYLIAMVAGYVKGIEDRHRDVPLAFFTPASQIDQARASFAETREIMAFFEKEIGVNYPWAKYFQVVVDDFTWGGMENTSLTVLTDRTLHLPETEQIWSSRGLVAHEMAHQWFGDFVTCKDWSHLWLNEGFATYYTHLYEGHKAGRDELLYGMYQAAKGFMSTPNDTNAIVRRNFNNPEEQFGFHAYPKGAWILHMLRNELGEELYRRCIKTHLERHALANATTDDLNKVIEELSGRSFDQFFDQYVYHAHQPELGISYSWDERSKLARITVSQNQKLSEDVLLFNVPLTIRFKGKSGSVDRRLTVKEKSEDFYLPLAEQPVQVRIDPELALLAKVSFTPSAAMLDAQITDKSDMLGRLYAVESLSGKREALASLKDRLNNDVYWGVRIAASQSIRAIGTDEAMQALIQSTRQPDARVRRQIVWDLAGFFREPGRDALLRLAREDKNPDIRSASMSGLGAWRTPEVREEALKFLRSDSYRAVLADGAMTALRGQDDASLVAPVLAALREHEAGWPATVCARGLETIAWLSRHEEKKDVVREFLVERVNSPKKRVQQAALAGLGTLGDPKAISVLEKFATLPKESPERVTAEKSLASLRDAKKPAVEFGTLRADVLKVQQENKSLRKELDDLKKKFDASLPKTAAPKPARK